MCLNLSLFSVAFGISKFDFAPKVPRYLMIDDIVIERGILAHVLP